MILLLIRINVCIQYCHRLQWRHGSRLQRGDKPRSNSLLCDYSQYPWGRYQHPDMFTVSLNYLLYSLCIMNFRMRLLSPLLYSIWTDVYSTTLDTSWTLRTLVYCRRFLSESSRWRLNVNAGCFVEFSRSDTVDNRYKIKQKSNGKYLMCDQILTLSQYSVGL